MPHGAESIFQGDPSHYQEDNGSPANSEVNMWCAVITQAWIDAFTEGEAIRGARPYEWDTVRAEARRWLLINHSGWKRDRDDVCARAGFDGDMVRREAVKRMEMARIEDVARRETALAGIDRAFESLLAREAAGMKRGEVTRAMRHLAYREANI